MKRRSFFISVIILGLLLTAGCQKLFPEKNDAPAVPPGKRISQLYQEAADSVAGQKYDIAAEKLKEITALAPDDGDVYMVLCQVYSVMGELKDGPGACEKSIGFDRNNPQAYAYLGNLYFYGKKQALAQKQLKLALVLDPENVSALGTLGAIYVQQKQYEEAVVVLEKAHDLDKKNAAVSLNLATSLLLLGRCDDAAKIVDGAKTAGIKTETFLKVKDTHCAGAAPPVSSVSTDGMALFKDDAGNAFYLDNRSANGIEFSGCVDGGVCKRPPYDEYNRKGEGRDEPAMSVNYFGAEAYCKWKGKRLPSLAEYKVAYKELQWRGCCVRGIIPREWTSDPGPSEEKGIQVRNNAGTLSEMTKKRKVGVDSSTVRCAVDAPSK